MNDTDKRKTLYDEIFKNDKAPEVTTNNGNQEIKDAIDNKEFSNNDIVNLEDIFVFDDKDKNTIPKEIKSDSKPKAGNDDKYNDLINNTLIDLKLDLENISKESSELQNINLDNIIKENDDIKPEEIADTKIKSPEVQNDDINSKKEAEFQLEKVVDSKDNCQTGENSIIKTEINQDTKIPKDIESKKTKKSSCFWINYALVAALIMLAIFSSLAFLIHQFK